jgi:hypothetical protein
MREHVRKAIDTAIAEAVKACKRAARYLAQPGLSDAAILGIAFSIADGAAEIMRTELTATEDGKELIARGKRKAAGKLPS